MSDATINVVLVITMVFAVAGALVSLLVIALRIANTRLGEHLLTTRGGRSLLRLYPVRQMAHWLDDNLLYDIAFVDMAQDHSYQVEARRSADEFAIADWEAFQLGVTRQ
jgi:hypothetical protein